MTPIINKKDKAIQETRKAPESIFSGLRFLPLALTVVCILFTAVMAAYVLWLYRDGYQEETAAGEVYERYYMLITQDDKTAFWQSIYQGAIDRALTQNVYVDWLGSDQFRGYSVEERMQVAVASGVDGIIVTANESEEMTALIDEAVAAGIPVVTLYGDSASSGRCSFVGVGAYNLGREYGGQVLQIARERLLGLSDTLLRTEETEVGAQSTSLLREEPVEIGTAERPVKVTLLVNAYARGLDQNILFSGVQETLEQGRGDACFSLSVHAVDDTNAFSVEESIRDLFMNGDIPDILICLNELNTTCAYQAVVDYNKVGTVSILGHYRSDTILKAIERGVIYATVDINAPQMGAFCVDALQEYHSLGYTSQYFTADVTLISRENVGAWLEEGGLPHDG